MSYTDFNKKTNSVKANLLNTYGILLGSYGNNNKFSLYRLDDFYVEVISEKMGESILAKTFLSPLEKLYYGLPVQKFGDISAEDIDHEIEQDDIKKNKGFRL